MPWANRKFWALLALAFILRASYSLTRPEKLTYPDEGSFDSISETIAETSHYGYPQPTATRTPGYVLFLATSYKLFGHSYRGARLMQSLLGTALVALIYMLAIRWTGSVFAAELAATIAAVYPFFIYYDAKMMADSYLTFWLTAFLLLSNEIQRHGETVTAWLKWGFAAAVLCLTKVIFLPLCFAVLGIEELRGFFKKDILSRVLGGALGLLLLVTPLAFWAQRNARIFGEWTLDTHGGKNLVEAIVFNDAAKAGKFIEVFATAPIQIHAMLIPNEVDRDRYYRQEASAYVRANPGLYLKQSLIRLKDFWRFYPRPEVSFQEGTHRLIAISLLTEPFLIIVGFLGLWRERRNAELYPAFLAILMLSAIHALITGQMRYRLPLMPILIIMAASVIAHAQKNRPSDH